MADPGFWKGEVDWQLILTPPTKPGLSVAIEAIKSVLEAIESVLEAIECT